MIMSETSPGSRDDRGHWRPDYLLQIPPHWQWPPRLPALLKWLFQFPGYLWPWNLLYLVIPVVAWLYLTPSLATMQTFEAGWIGIVLARNLAITLLFFGAWHVYFYVIKKQKNDYKYNAEPPATGTRRFLFGNQVGDNIFWTLASGVTIWSAYEVITLWAYANGFLPYIDWETNPILFALVLLLVPLLRDVHFYLVHRLLHWRPLYKAAHYLHHRNVNIGPWSGMSMHPIEHLLYFSGVLLHWVIPSHPIHALYHLFHAGLSPAKGHCGFERIVAGRNSLQLGNYFHYLHHTQFECNYGSDGMPILDKIFGSFHDGSEQAERRVKQLRMARSRG
jgi:sterol desaturase/sphingolipid hydroxylase (fatty acid hydroxylase superfamily)